MAGFRNIAIDPEVLRAAQTGDMGAHATIYKSLAPPVYTLMARMTGSTATADDLLQETFVEVIRSIARFRGDASLATWVRRIAVSKCLMHMRSAWQNRATLFRDLGEDHPATAPGVASGAQRSQAQLDLERALARLSDTSRLVVILHDIEGYTHREIAELIGQERSVSPSHSWPGPMNACVAATDDGADVKRRSTERES